MTWRLSINDNGIGEIGSDDYDGGNVSLTSVQDVHELVNSIDIVLREGGSRNFIREGDGVLIEVYPSQSRPGKYVIERNGGNWIRLSREDLRDLRNELLRRVSNVRGNYGGEAERVSGREEDAMDIYIRKMKQLNQMNTDMVDGAMKRMSAYQEMLEKIRRSKR